MTQWSTITSGMGQSRHFGRRQTASGLLPEADIITAGRHVSKVPNAEIMRLPSVAKARSGPSDRAIPVARTECFSAVLLLGDGHNATRWLHCRWRAHGRRLSWPSRISSSHGRTTNGLWTSPDGVPVTCPFALYPQHITEPMGLGRLGVPTTATVASGTPPPPAARSTAPTVVGTTSAGVAVLGLEPTPRYHCARDKNASLCGRHARVVRARRYFAEVSGVPDELIMPQTACCCDPELTRFNSPSPL